MASNRCIPVKSIISWSAVVCCVCQLILLCATEFYAVFCVAAVMLNRHAPCAWDQLPTCPTPSPGNCSLNDIELWHYRKTPRHRLITNVTDIDMNMGFKECVRNCGRETLENVRWNGKKKKWCLSQTGCKVGWEVTVRGWETCSMDVWTWYSVRLSWINQCPTFWW
jgi:hypothetical protein